MNNSLRVYISEKNHGSIILILHHDYYWNKTCVIMVRSTKQYGTFFLFTCTSAQLWKYTC